MKQRILVVSHGHPDFSLGGAEIAAYNLFEAFKNNDDVEDTWFLARADRGRGVTGQIHKRHDNEYLWEQGVADWHLMKSAHQESVTTWFVDLLKSLSLPLYTFIITRILGSSSFALLKNTIAALKFT